MPVDEMPTNDDTAQGQWEMSPRRNGIETYTHRAPGLPSRTIRVTGP